MFFAKAMIETGRVFAREFLNTLDFTTDILGPFCGFEPARLQRISVEVSPTGRLNQQLRGGSLYGLNGFVEERVNQFGVMLG